MGKRFLIGQLGCFGDCLYATTIAHQIKNDFHDSHITWAVGSKYKSILINNPDVDLIWEISSTYGNYSNIGWEKFEKEALTRRNKGDFDEIIFSQISPRNWIKFTGTIRGTILRAYPRPITVSVSPIVCLSNEEITRVKQFAHVHVFKRYNNIILFECAPGSGQSKIDVNFAIEVAKRVIASNSDVCFVISTPKKIDVDDEQIIDASELTYIENAELTKYCTLLVGCSSGITWLSTSNWAKKIPMLQLLSDNSIFTGVHYDFALNGLDNRHIIEMIKFDSDIVIKCIRSILDKGVEATKSTYHQNYKPSLNNFEYIIGLQVYYRESIFKIIKSTRLFLRRTEELGNIIKVNYFSYLKRLIYLKISMSENSLILCLRKQRDRLKREKF